MGKKFLAVSTAAFMLLATTILWAQGSSQDPKFLHIGTASLGGNFFPMGAAIAVVIDKNIEGVKASAQATGGSAFNINAIQKGEMEIGLAQSTAVAAAMTGTGQFEGVKIDKMRTIASCLEMPTHILLRPEKMIKSLTDLKGLKIEMLAIGDGVEVSSRKILEAVNLSWDKDINRSYSGNRVQAAARLKTGQVDCIMDSTGIGNAWLVDVIGDGRFALYSMSEKEVQATIEKNPEFSRSKIPAGSYKNQGKDVNTVASVTVIVGSSDLSTDLVYQITKNLFANKKYLVESHKFFTDLAPENVAKGVVAPLHPGALKYYKEIGIIK